VHGSTREKVHFHEVGAVDALVDVVGTLEGLRALGVEEVYSSPLRLGRGAVHSEHGLIPVPAPATTLLLRGVPVEMPDIEAELVTPTGAALLTTLVRHWSGEPAFRLERVGTGAGGRDLKEQPNVLRVLIGERDASALPRRRVVVLETALDDDNPQFVAAVVSKLLQEGALDAMVVPSVMKKGRPGMWLVVVADPDRSDALARMLLRETSALGVRVRVVRSRWRPRSVASRSRSPPSLARVSARCPSSSRCAPRPSGRAVRCARSRRRRSRRGEKARRERRGTVVDRNAEERPATPVAPEPRTCSSPVTSR
jgi:uncharacterized protein (TIGR00299 family) protein